MAKLQRKTQKIFSLNAATNEHAVFGTMKNIVNNEQPQYSMDVEVLQSGTAFLLGWQNAVVAGFAPFLEEMNGVLYVITSQLAYLLNNGVAEYDANTTYYQGDIIKVINNGVPTLKYSVIDNNTGNATSDEDYWADLISETDLPIATTQTPGIVQPDGETITITPQGIISAQGSANTDLSNLTSDGNAKFQYAPFSINNGTIDGNGQNATLSTVGDVPVSVDKYVVPVLSSTTSEYGTASDIILTRATDYNNRPANPWTMQLADDNHIPAGAIVTFTIATTNVTGDPGAGATDHVGCKGVKIVYTYTDNTTQTILDENGTGNFAGWNSDGGHSATIILNAPSKEVKAIQITGYYNFGKDYNYYSAWGVTFKAQYTVSSADTLICSPCTITTADSRTKTFSADNLLDCSSVSDGNYKVMKSYTNGSLSLSNTVSVNKNIPSSPSNGDLWLDNSEYPLTLKQYNGSNWQTNNDLVYIGDITVSSGVITGVSNNNFNKYGYLLNDKPTIIETYQNGTSWYRVYSDGWCEQGGKITFSNGTSGHSVILLKSYKDTNYSLFLANMEASYTTTYSAVRTSASQFKAYTETASSRTLCWSTQGYIE